MDIENLPERVKRIMKDQPLNPFVKMEVRLLPRQRAVRRQPGSNDQVDPIDLAKVASAKESTFRPLANNPPTARS